MRKEWYQCECGDKGCPVHLGVDECKNEGNMVLYRIDMEDNTGTYFCNECAQDALDSGVFTD